MNENAKIVRKRIGKVKKRVTKSVIEKAAIASRKLAVAKRAEHIGKPNYDPLSVMGREEARTNIR